VVFLNYSLHFLTDYWVLHVFSDQRAGLSPWDAVISAMVRRFRPILLTVLTAIPGADSTDPEHVPDLLKKEWRGTCSRQEPRLLTTDFREVKP
jgi:hypothetical protein